jgi:hypothetical protein
VFTLLLVGALFAVTWLDGVRAAGVLR